MWALDGRGWLLSRPGRFTSGKIVVGTPLGRKLDGTQNRSGRGGEKIKSLPYLCLESNPIHNCYYCCYHHHHHHHHHHLLQFQNMLVFSKKASGFLAETNPGFSFYFRSIEMKLTIGMIQLYTEN
jgi:hypothetical protein